VRPGLASLPRVTLTTQGRVVSYCAVAALQDPRKDPSPELSRAGPQPGPMPLAVTVTEPTVYKLASSWEMYSDVRVCCGRVSGGDGRPANVPRMASPICRDLSARPAGAADPATRKGTTPAAAAHRRASQQCPRAQRHRWDRWPSHP
jgi:hypothetical protein